MSVFTSLGIGSGIDTKALIDGLVAAETSARKTPLTTRSTALDAQISALGQTRSALQGIATSLSNRIGSGALGLQPSSSDATTVGIDRFGTGPTAAFAAQLGIASLAAGQRLVAPSLASAAAPVGLGTLTIGFGRRTGNADGSFTFTAGTQPPVDIAIDAASNSLTGLRDAINAAGAPIAATIVGNAGNATLSIKARDGADWAFVISAAGDADIRRFSYTPGDPQMTLASSAADASLSLDGIAVTRDSNSISDLVPGTMLTLRKPGNAQLAATRDTAPLAATVADLAGTLTAMRGLIADFRKGATSTDPAGALAADPTARAMDQRITSLISAAIPEANGLRLRDLGVSISRTGEISYDASRLAALPANRIGDAEALLRTIAGPAQGKALRLQAIADLAAPATDGLTKRRQQVTDLIAKTDTRLTMYRDQLTRQYAAMEQAVAASKAVGTALDQQVKAWYGTGSN